MDDLASRATLPFKILQDMQIPAAYERSFKIDAHGVFANRYMLGIQKHFLKGTLGRILEQLECPFAARAELSRHQPDSSMALLGCEEANGEISYRFYLDYYERVIAQQRDTNASDFMPVLAFQGWKWNVDGTAFRRTDYWQQLNVSREDIRATIVSVLGRSSSLTEPIVQFMDAVCAGTNCIPKFVVAEDAKQKIEAWLVDYNEQRARSVLGNLARTKFALSGRASPAG
ncbi:transposase [Rhodopirellula sp.]|nr:transposase [Rhodopirellula sp.]